MRLKNRVEKLERGARLGLCPCRTPGRIEIVDESEGETETPDAGPCKLCGLPLPVTRIVVVRRPAVDRL